MRAKVGMEAGTTIRQPNLSIFGTATVENFYNSFNERLLTNGLFSRLMIIDLGDNRGLFHQPGKYKILPEQILEDAKFWMEKANASNGNLSWENPSPVEVPYSGDAQKMLLNFTHNKIDKNYENAKDEVTRVAWTRGGENARKLALLYACSEDARTPRISEKAVEWATRFIVHLIKRQLYQISVHYASSPFHELCLKALGRIRKAKCGEMSRGVLLKALNIKARELDEIEDTLEQRGDIEIVLIPTTKRPRTVYQYKP